MTPPSSIAEFQEHLADWRKVLRLMTQHTRNAIQALFSALMFGESRSRLLVPRGPDVDVPRVLTPDHDLAWADRRSVAESTHLPLAIAWQNGWLRTIPARQEVLGEFVTLIDLSLSILSDAAGETGQAALQSPVNNKLAALLAAAGCANALAEGSGLTLRTVFMRQGGKVMDLLRGQRNQGYPMRVLDKTEHLLFEVVRTSWATAREPQTSILHGLQHVLREVRGKGIVVIISDFLEPHETFRNALQDVMARHKVVLLDIASPRDLRFPESEAGPDLKFLGARHLEDGGLRQRANNLHHIRDHNALVAANHSRIDALIKGRARREKMTGRTFQSLGQSVRAALASTL